MISADSEFFQANKIKVESRKWLELKINSSSFENNLGIIDGAAWIVVTLLKNCTFK